MSSFIEKFIKCISPIILKKVPRLNKPILLPMFLAYNYKQNRNIFIMKWGEKFNKKQRKFR